MTPSTAVDVDLPVPADALETAAPRRTGWELGGLLGAALVSLVGDQVARVALTVLVFQRSSSAALAAATYAATFLPVVVAGPLLGGLADRLPRRRVLVTTDLLRAAVFAVMAVPGVPLPLLLLLVLLACTAGAPFAAARSATMRDISATSAAYQRATSLDEALDCSGQVLGFAGAGLVLVLVGPHTALLLDAATFVVSAAVLRLLVQHRPAAAPEQSEQAGRLPLRARWARARQDARTGWRAALAPACRRPLLLTWAGLSCAVAPEALATPWAERLGAGTVGAGLLFAAAPAGAVLGLGALTRTTGERAERALLPLTVLSLLPLALCLLDPPLQVVLVLVALSGAGTNVSVLARVAFVAGLSDAHRGRAFSVAATGVTVVQGLGMGAAALLTLVVAPAAAVATTAAAGLVLVALAERGLRT